MQRMWEWVCQYLQWNLQWMPGVQRMLYYLFILCRGVCRVLGVYRAVLVKLHRRMQCPMRWLYRVFFWVQCWV